MAIIKASFDVTTVAGQMKAFNAMNGASTSLKNLESGTTIEAVAVMQHEETTDSYGKEQAVTVTTIFAKDGSSFAGISDTVAKAGSSLIDFISATGVEAFNVQIVKAKSSKNQEFINLQLVG